MAIYLHLHVCTHMCTVVVYTDVARERLTKKYVPEEGCIIVHHNGPTF